MSVKTKPAELVVYYLNTALTAIQDSDRPTELLTREIFLLSQTSDLATQS